MASSGYASIVFMTAVLSIGVSVLLFMNGSKSSVLTVGEAVCWQGGLPLIGVYSALFMGMWCFKQADLA
jgi:hypothetical protein